MFARRDAGRWRECLGKRIVHYSNEYDFCIIDCPPSLGPLSTMSLVASDYVVIPTTASLFASKGVVQLASTIHMVQEYANPSLKIAGILFAKHHPEQRNACRSREVAGVLSEKMGATVFNSFIREAVEVEDTHNGMKTIVERNPLANPSQDYVTFVDELLAKLEG